MKIAHRMMAMTFLATSVAVMCSAAHAPQHALNRNATAEATPAPKAISCAVKEQAVLTRHLSEKYRKSVDFTHRIVRAAYREGTRFGLPPSLLLAIVEQESSLRPDAQSNYGAVGLMQVVPRFHPEKVTALVSPDALNDPDVNIRVGSWIFAEYLWKKNGDLDAAMAKYSGNASNYAQKVTSFQKGLDLVKAKAQAECTAPRTLRSA